MGNWQVDRDLRIWMGFCSKKNFGFKIQFSIHLFCCLWIAVRSFSLILTHSFLQCDVQLIYIIYIFCLYHLHIFCLCFWLNHLLINLEILHSVNNNSFSSLDPVGNLFQQSQGDNSHLGVATHSQTFSGSNCSQLSNNSHHLHSPQSQHQQQQQHQHHPHQHPPQHSPQQYNTGKRTPHTPPYQLV